MIDLSKMNYSNWGQSNWGQPQQPATQAAAPATTRGVWETGGQQQPMTRTTTAAPAQGGEGGWLGGDSGTWAPGTSSPMTNSGGGSRPSWMPSNAYRYGIDNEDWGSTINDDIVQQTWWRAPNWLYNGGSSGGNGIMWNPDVGWQTTQDIKKYYHGMGDTPVTQDLFMQGGWTNRLGSTDWTTYFDPYTGARDYGGGANNYSDSELVPIPPEQQAPVIPNQNYGWGDQTGGYGGDVPTPGEWQTATDTYERFANGLPTAVPDSWLQGQGVASAMAQTGMPTSYAPWYQQAKGVAQTDIMDSINQAAESAGLNGLRWSSPMGRTAQDIAGRRMAELGANWTDKEMGAQEAARQRQMEATNQLLGFGQATTGLAESAKDRALAGAGGLGQMGGMRTGYESDLAKQLMSQGTAYQQLQQGQLDKMLQEIMRGMPENSPWLQYVNSTLGASQPGGQYVPQSYQPSGMSGIMGIMSLLPLLL